MTDSVAIDGGSQQSDTRSVAPSPLHEGPAADSFFVDDILRLLPRASERVACLCAEKLLRGSLMTPRLAEIFLRRRDRASLMVLSEGDGISPFILNHLAKSGTPDEARAIAAGYTLSDEVLSRLIERNDPIIHRSIAECSGEPLPDAILQTLIQRALADARLARIMLSRKDLTATQRTSLFVHASPRERMAILTFANTQAAAKPHSVQQERLNALCAVIGSGDASGLTLILADAIGIPFPTLYPLLGESSGSLLALALKGMDVPDRVIRRACQWVQARHAGLPGGVEDVLETVTPSSALWIVSALASAALSTCSQEDVTAEPDQRLIA